MPQRRNISKIILDKCQNIWICSLKIWFNHDLFKFYSFFKQSMIFTTKVKIFDPLLRFELRVTWSWVTSDYHYTKGLINWQQNIDLYRVELRHVHVWVGRRRCGHVWRHASHRRDGRARRYGRGYGRRRRWRWWPGRWGAADGGTDVERRRRRVGRRVVRRAEVGGGGGSCGRRRRRAEMDFEIEAESILGNDNDRTSSVHLWKEKLKRVSFTFGSH